MVETAVVVVAADTVAVVVEAGVETDATHTVGSCMVPEVETEHATDVVY